MTDIRPFSQEEAEFAFVRPRELIAQLPPSTERNRAEANISTAEQYVHEILEKMPPTRAEDGE